MPAFHLFFCEPNKPVIPLIAFVMTGSSDPSSFGLLVCCLPGVCWTKKSAFSMEQGKPPLHSTNHYVIAHIFGHDENKGKTWDRLGFMLRKVEGVNDVTTCECVACSTAYCRMQ